MKAFLVTPLKKKQFHILTLDAVFVFLSFILSYAFRVLVYEKESISLILKKPTWLVLIAVILHLVCLYIFELYNLEVERTHKKNLFLIALSVLIATGFLAIFSYLDPYNKLGRVVLATHVPLAIFFIYIWRRLFFSFFQQNGAKNNLLLIGNSNLDKEIFELVNKLPIKNYSVVERVCDYKENPGTIHINGSISDKTIRDIVKEQNIKTVVISEKIPTSSILRNELFDLKYKNVAIYNSPVFYTKLTGKIPVYYINDAWFLFNNQEMLFGDNYWKNIKKLLDVVSAFTLLFVSAPLLFFSCLAIKLSSPGPVFFKQERLGQYRKPYTLIKLRTMIVNAEKERGPQWASRDDPRVTMVGRVLRKMRVDEIPQLINVLKGEMSLVGPRPIRECFEDEFCTQIPFYHLRHVVKPGLTGWAQVKDFDPRSDNGPLERLQYDLFYIQNQSFFFDLYILLKTTQTILFRPGQ